MEASVANEQGVGADPPELACLPRGILLGRLNARALGGSANNVGRRSYSTAGCGIAAGVLAVLLWRVDLLLGSHAA
jgi:hypothetical protein